MRFEIDAPCGERWEAMRPTREGRFCDACRKDVVDLSRMTRREAERRVKAAPDGSLCAQLALDEHGHAVFRPEPRRAPHWAGGLVLVAALTAGGCARSEPEPTPRAQVEPEPCELDGPPMVPVEDAAAVVDAASDPAPYTGPVPSDVVDDDPTPTAEQRALTTRKQRQQIIHHVRGRIRPRF